MLLEVITVVDEADSWNDYWRSLKVILNDSLRFLVLHSNTVLFFKV